MRVGFGVIVALGVSSVASCAFDWDGLDPRQADGGGGAGASATGGSATGGSAIGGSGGVGGEEEACTGSTILCDGECVDPQQDLEHCGDCGVACASSEICLPGGCALPPSCQALLEARPGSADGPYTLEPGGVAAFEAHCDMTTDGGGWTLVASIVDNSYFNGLRCTPAGCDMTPPSSCDESPFTEDAVAGDVATMLMADHKSEAYGALPFDEMLFADSNGQWASYEVSGASVAAWYPAGLENWVPSMVEEHDSFSYPVKATNIDPMLNECGSLRLSFNVEDSDSQIGGNCHASTKGPAWPGINNGVCFWDDAINYWGNRAFYSGNPTAYRLWLVR